jgi:hypothetical protein
MSFALYLNSFPQIEYSNVGHVFILIEGIWWVLGLAIYIYIVIETKTQKPHPRPYFKFFFIFIPTFVMNLGLIKTNL